MVMGPVGDIRNYLKKMPYTVRVGNIPGGLSEFISIQAAIDYCDNETGDWVIEVYPGTYVEGDITPNGGADITIKAIGEERVVIAPAADPAVAVIVSAHTLNLEDIKVTAFSLNFPALRVTAGTCTITRGELNGVGVGDAVQQVGGTLTLHNCYVPVGDIDLTDAACTLIVDDCDINGTLDTSDGVGAAVVMSVRVNHTDCNGQAFNLAATGACVYEFHSNNEIGAITDASLGAGVVNGHMCRCYAGGAFVKNGTTGWLIDNSEVLSINNANAVGVIAIFGGYLHTCAGSVGDILWYFPEMHEWRVIAGMNPADALAAMAVGDTIRVGRGTFALAAQLARAIDDVKIVGSGLGTRFTLDGVTPVITAGVQDGWVLKDFDVDAGLVEIQFATNSTLHNITINGLHATIINPDVGQTNFPGQPVIRTEEIRPLDPAATEIIKDYSKKEYQLFDPTFATPKFIMNLLNRQARTLELPLNGAWADGSTGGSVTIYPLYMLLNTTNIANRDGLAYCVAAFLNAGGINFDRVDWDNKQVVAFDIARTLGDNAALRGRVQLKRVTAEGILANEGIGIEVQNYALYGECFLAGGARATVSLATTMVVQHTYRVRWELWPTGEIKFFVNDIYKASLTTNIPVGNAGGTMYFVASMDNAAVAVDSSLVISPILIWNHL